MYKVSIQCGISEIRIGMGHSDVMEKDPLGVQAHLRLHYPARQQPDSLEDLVLWQVKWL